MISANQRGGAEARSGRRTRRRGWLRGAGIGLPQPAKKVRKERQGHSKRRNRSATTGRLRQVPEAGGEVRPGWRLLSPRNVRARIGRGIASPDTYLRTATKPSRSVTVRSSHMGTRRQFTVERNREGSRP